MSIYNLKAELNNKKIKSFEDYKDKVLLIVNTASQCGFTPQYKGLQVLFEKYNEIGLEVLAFPCNQFGAQEKGNAEEIKNFCEMTYSISFPIFSKISVNGPTTHPLYAFLKKERPGLLGSEKIKWNFTKFLVDKKGVVTERFSPQTKPEKIESSIIKLLGL